MDKKYRLISLYTRVISNEKDLTLSLKKDKGYLIFIDIRRFKDWSSIISRISAAFRSVKFCVISDTSNDAVKIINAALTVCGYLDKSERELFDQLKELLISLYSRIHTICSGLLVKTTNGSLKVIPYGSIYYIETEKSTHYCKVIHENGVDLIRADISELIKKLDSRFEIIRSSTIANLSAVKNLYDQELIFDNNQSCFIANQKTAFIKKRFETEYVF